MGGTEWRAMATIWHYVMAVLSGIRGACIVCVCVCVCVIPLAGGLPVPGLRPSSLGCGLLPLYVRGQGFGGGV